MQYAFIPERPIPEEVRRLATEQGEFACALLSARQADAHEAIHEARRALRRIRTLLVLLRPQLGVEYRRVRDPYRRCSHALTRLRDAHAVVEAFERIVQHEPGALGPDLATTVRCRLVRRRDRLLRAEPPNFVALRRALRQAQRGMTVWPSIVRGDPLLGGMRRCYALGRRAMATALRRDQPEDLHRWRRRVRELALQHDLMHLLVPALQTNATGRARRLGHMLGRERELLILGKVIGTLRLPASETPALVAFQQGIEAQRGMLRDRMRALGQAVYRERPRRWEKQLRQTMQTRAIAEDPSVDAPPVAPDKPTPPPAVPPSPRKTVRTAAARRADPGSPPDGPGSHRPVHR
jgi:CHAD domain-containing protein